ncbi:coiled-coil domain-containing protein 122-like [Centropristis striata]|uniref:coiled-coil domain-containing protein 122-like n=1 Tax=Centropristis striata TaxID=184440 RepID=UPI0027E1D5DD|nr:coiled-coil domain-containing protein 122-like [Centropristis striata]
MSTFSTREDGMQEKPEFSLSKAVEDVSQHGFAQTEVLKEKQKTLQSLQATLSEIEKKGATSELELRSSVREFLMLEGEMEHLEQQIKVLHDDCSYIRKENTGLQMNINEVDENACLALVKFKTYINKMEGHRAAVVHAASQTEAYKELEEKRALVRMLTQKKKEMKEDLEYPNGNPVHRAMIGTITEEISVMSETIAKKREQVQKELETQAKIRKDIEIQNRRYEAILKRLACQLSKAQAVHRQMSEEVYQMERQLARLREQLKSTQDGLASGH